MVKKTAFAAGLFALILAATQAGAPKPWAAPQAPPLEGAFADNFTLLEPPIPAPPDAFVDLAGATVRLADFKGRVVLLNFWATWCAPCIREMPSLDRLQAALKDRDLAVLAVSIDRGGVKVIVPFAERLRPGRMGRSRGARADRALPAPAGAGDSGRIASVSRVQRRVSWLGDILGRKRGHGGGVKPCIVTSSRS